MRPMGCLRNCGRDLQKAQAQENCTGEGNLKDSGYRVGQLEIGVLMDL